MIQAQTCGQCGRFSLPPGENLSAHGFGRCEHMPEWRKPSSAAACAFNPIRFEGRA